MASICRRQKPQAETRVLKMHTKPRCKSDRVAYLNSIVAFEPVVTLPPDLTADERLKIARWHGYIVPSERERLKYGRVPDNDAPVGSWVVYVINFVRVKWSGVVDCDEQRPLVDWFAVYFSRGCRYRLDPICVNHAKAEEYLRQLWGLSPVPTSDWARLTQGDSL